MGIGYILARAGGKMFGAWAELKLLMQNQQ